MIAGWEHITSRVIDGRTVYAQGVGAFQGGGCKLILHTTEGSNVEGSINTLYRNRSWPHFHIDYKTKRKIQYLEVNVAGKALSNNVSDGYPTNKSNCVQVEIEGYAADAAFWSKDTLGWIASCLSEIRLAFEFPLIYLQVEDSRRFSDREFHEFTGILGHKNVPDNDHTDPGRLDVPYIVSRMKGGIVNPGEITKDQIDYIHILAYGDKPGTGYDYRHVGGSLHAYLTEVFGADPLKNPNVLAAKVKNGQLVLPNTGSDIDKLYNDQIAATKKVFGK